VLLTAASLMAAEGLLSASARAAQLVEADVRPLAGAYRASKVIGASTVNDKSEKSGSVDDLTITQKDLVLTCPFGWRLPGHRQPRGRGADFESDVRRPGGPQCRPPWREQERAHQIATIPLCLIEGTLLAFDVDEGGSHACSFSAAA
jgi:hypothetical protein